MEEGSMFQTLTDDELLNIARSDAFEPKQAMHFWKTTSFSRCAPFLFRQILLECNELSLGNSATGEVLLGCDSDVEETILLCGQVFTNLRINSSVPRLHEEEDVFQLGRLFKDGSNLSLRIVMGENLAPELILVKVLGKTFDGLDLHWSFRNVQDIPANFLNCIGTAWSSLKRFSYTGRDRSSLSPLWINGEVENLEELSIECKSYRIVQNGKWKRALNDIRENCPKLWKILLNDPLNDPEVTEDMYVKFLTSFGTQLVEAAVHRLGEENLGRLAESCHNLRCFQYENENRLGRICALGNRIKMLVLHLEPVSNMEQISTAISLCTSMEEFTLNISGADNMKNTFRKLFVQRMECLEFLKIQSEISGSDLMDISTKTSQLKSASFERFAKIDGKSIKALIEANPKIIEISIQEHFVDHAPSGDDTLAMCRGIVEALSDCSIHKLPIIDISSRKRSMPNIEEMKNVCNVLRIRPGTISFSFRGRKFSPVKSISYTGD